MKWRKLGHLFTPNPVHEKLLSHAANPVAILLREDVYRVFYSGRDRFSRSSVSWVDIDIEMRKVVDVAFKPIFEFGAPGSYFDRGISVGCSYEIGKRVYLLFMGWQVPEGGHWRGVIGRLQLMNRTILKEDGALPLLGRSAEDPLSLSYPWVDCSGGEYRMWYGSTVSWDAGNGEMLHVIKSARSVDGDHWEPLGQAVPHQIGIAQAFSRPAVRQRCDGRLDMWFSYRGAPSRTYRIGYAYSLDGRGWTLNLDEAGLEVSPEGWDAEMTCYPFVFCHRGTTYMLYNGNGYGRSGFGLAALDE